MQDTRWLWYAIAAAACAAVTSLFAKIGMHGIDSTLATAVRSVVMLMFMFAVCSAQGLWGKLPTIHAQALVMIALSGLAGASSWLFGFKALEVGGDVSQVGPIDKMSVPLAAILAFIFLKERPGTWNWVGITLIAVGAYLASLPRGT